jgi:Ser/Thr protein kinase RdoA (MazF antagonist)
VAVVRGLELADGRRVVVKCRDDAAGRVRGCVDVQRRLAAAGFPCPAPLAGPAPLGSRVVTAEEYVPGGAQLDLGADRARLFAEALARLVRLAPPPEAVPSLAPAPPWVDWEHSGDGVWPWPDDVDADLNAHPGPCWLDDLGARVRERLVGTRLPRVVGHADFESQNVRWRGEELLAVHDWDSVAALPEPAVAGAAAAVFTEAAARATVEESARFLECYVRARGADWGPEEWGVAWAAGLWVRAFNAKKAVVAARLEGAEGEPELLHQLAEQAEERLRLMG